MKIRAKVYTIVMGCGLIAAAFVVDGWLESGVIVKEVQARIGRPMTPGSVAGVARRTTRRRIRRTTIYIATLPRSCPQVNIDGTMLWYCGGRYYQSYGTQYVVVNVN